MAVLRITILVAALTTLAACSPTEGADFAEAGDVREDASGDAGGPTSCSAAVDCAAGETCRALYSCFNPPKSGYCVPFDGGCDLAYPVCACDGKIYSDTCALRVAGQNIADDPPKCDLPNGAFQCGAQICTIAGAYCSSSGCRVLPEACKVADAGCDCFVEAGVREQCQCGRANGGYFRFQCPN